MKHIKNNLKKKYKKLINNNIIRQIALFIYENYNLKNIRLNKFYIFLHMWFIFIIGFIALFNNNIIHLCVLLFIISMDAFSVVVLNECPLTRLEKKYLNITSSEMRTISLKQCGILYECDHEYEKQIELLINVWMIISGKCLIILFLKTFNIKLFNYNNIYI